MCSQNDRVKALKAMEMTWNNMEKKEKLMWIKKAAEDQKRYEVGGQPLCPGLVKWGHQNSLWGDSQARLCCGCLWRGSVWPARTVMLCLSLAKAGDSRGNGVTFWSPCRES